MYELDEVLRVVLRTDDVIAYIILPNGKKKFLHADEIRKYQRKDYEIFYI